MEKVLIYTNSYELPVYFLDRKAKKTLLFVHGFSSSYRFIGDLDQLDTNYNIVTFSLPGTQDVEAKGKLSIDLFVDIVNDLVNNHIKYSKVYLVGHSLGGLVCAEAGLNKKVEGVFFLAPVHPRIEDGKLFSKLKSVVEPEGLRQRVASKIVAKSFSVASAIRKKPNKAKDFIDESSPWNAIVKDTLMNKQYLKEHLRDNYVKLNGKAHYIVGSLDEVISASNFIKFVEEEMNKDVFVLVTGHHPLAHKTKMINDYLNKNIIFKRRFFTRSKAIVI